MVFLKNGPSPGFISVIFVFVLSQQFTDNILKVDFSGTRTQIIGVDGDQADHLTTTTAPCFFTNPLQSRPDD